MVTLDGQSLTMADVKVVAVTNVRVVVDQNARERMVRARGAVSSLVDANSPVYGVNTGVGLLANTRLSSSDLEQLQLNVIRSHACGCGAPLAREVVRAMMLIRANVLAKGLSGVRAEVAETLCQLLNLGVTPVVPSRGSVGASGDLAPLAHIALVLVGEGKAEVGGRICSGRVERHHGRYGRQHLLSQHQRAEASLSGFRAAVALRHDPQLGLRGQHHPSVQERR